MAEEAYKDYQGIPRTMIPWYPTIDEDLCVSCGVCVNACKHGTYAYDGTGKVIVAHPYNCEVSCESCRFQCEVDAISFPDRKAFKAVIKQLREKYPPSA